MAKREDIRSYTSTELLEMLARGEDESDWEAVRAKTEEQLEADIASDPDWADIPHDWYKDAELVDPRKKKLMSLRLDADVVDWFKAQGDGYQTKMNAVLKAFVEAQRKHNL
jgi:uncharacterized protein (DUF4415 family)